MNTYDIVLTALLIVGGSGSVVSSYLLHRRRREIRIYKQVKLETGYEVPKWLSQMYESTFRPDSKDAKGRQPK